MTTRDEPRGIEDALLEIELPGPRLLGQEAALQPVGEARDHALQMRELLVEQHRAAGSARRRSHSSSASTDLVAFGGEGAIDRRDRRCRADCAAGRRAGRGGSGSSSPAPGISSPCDLLGAVVAVVLVLLGHAAFERALGARWPRPRRPRSRSRSSVVVALALGVLALAPSSASPRSRSRSLMSWRASWRRRPGRSMWRVELDEVAADAALEEGPPGVDHLARRARRRRAGERLARQEPDRLGERHVVALGHVLVALAAIALLEHGREVGRRRRSCAARPAPRPAPARRPRRWRARSRRRARAAHGARRRDSAAGAPARRPRRAPAPPRAR